MAKSFQKNGRLRQERLQRHWRQADVAEQLGTTELTVRRWEQGRQQPGAYYRLKLCALFGKSAEELGLLEGRVEHVEQQQPDPLPEFSPLMQGQSFPLWHLPSPRNPFFTGRDHVLHRLHETLCGEHSAMLSQSYALSGLGGIGKTQTAIEYVYRYASDYTAVFWISAETTESIFSSFVSLARLLDLPEQQEREQSRITTAVMRWLNSHER